MPVPVAERLRGEIVYQMSLVQDQNAVAEGLDHRQIVTDEGYVRPYSVFIETAHIVITVLGMVAQMVRFGRFLDIVGDIKPTDWLRQH